MLTRLQCPVCGSPDATVRYAGHPLPIRECSCGMVFLWPQPATEELKDIYRAEYFRGWGADGNSDDSARAMKHATFARRLKRLAGVAPKGRVLDVGCATGYFLEAAATAGWDVYGVELSAYAAGLAARRFGNRVFNGTLEQAGYPDGYFDLVTLSDVLEHVPDPRSFLSEVKRVLRPGGTLFISTPDVKSLTARLMGRHWSHFNNEHLFYFSPDTIERLLNDCGFEIVHKSSAAKYLNISHVASQFRTHRHFLLTPLCDIIDSLLPAFIKRRNILIRSGEMQVIARRS